MIVISDENIFVRNAMHRIITEFTGGKEEVKVAATDAEAGRIAYTYPAKARMVILRRDLPEAMRIRKSMRHVVIVMVSNERPLNFQDLDVHWFDRDHGIPELIQFLKGQLTAVPKTA